MNKRIVPPETTNEQLFCSVQEMAAILGVGRETTRKLARETGTVIRIGRRLLIDKQALIDKIRENQN